MEHAKRTKLILYGEKNPKSIHTDEQIEKVCYYLQEGYRNYEIAKLLKISQFTVGLIRAGTVWKDISSKYQFMEKSRTLSDATVRWVCRQIVKGLTQSEILALCKNPRLTITMIKDIRRKRIYKDISKEYF